MSDLRDQIRNLTLDQKFELLDALWESVEGEARQLSAAQRAELDDRIARYKEHPADVIPWEQVKTGVFKPS